MPHRRFTIDLAIPLDAQGELPAALRSKPTAGQLSAMADMTWAQIIKEMIRRLRSYAEKINDGTTKEEPTDTAKEHVCRHQEGLPCDGETDI